MSVFVNKETRVLVQGITGKQGHFHSKSMLEYGTRIVAGVTPGKKGETVHGVPVFNSVKEAIEGTGKVDYSVLFVPARFFLNAAREALEEGLNLVAVTEHVPVHDVIELVGKAREKGRIIIGPNTPGVIVPRETKLGIMPQEYFKKGSIGVVSRSGTLTYEIVRELSRAGLGQSTVVGVGGGKVTGLSLAEVIEEFETDRETKAIVLVGEVGGSEEEKAAEFIERNVSTPVVAFIAGRFAPKEKTFGHAGAIVHGNKGTAESKINALRKAGVEVVKGPFEVAEALKKLI